jgi:hypothetical protein
VESFRISRYLISLISLSNIYNLISSISIYLDFYSTTERREAKEKQKLKTSNEFKKRKLLRINNCKIKDNISVLEANNDSDLVFHVSISIYQFSHILSYLNVHDLFETSILVCKSWNKVSIFLTN